MFKFTMPVLMLFCLAISKQAICENATMTQVNTCLSRYRYDGHPMHLSEKAWKEKLSHDEFESLRKKRIDYAYNNSFYNSTKSGIYRCAGCDLPLFSSIAKYDGNNGHACFTSPVCQDNVKAKFNWNIFSKWKEVFCSRCDGFIGKVYRDEPTLSGKKYTVNSASLKFAEQ